jgi:2'-5' RNA ligase
MRLFFALWPPAETAAALHAWANNLEGRPTRPENIHLTLAFLGEADPIKACAAARRVQGERHDLPIEHAEYWRHNKIVWVGPREIPEPLDKFVKALHAELAGDGFVLEARRFAAHVTLLRKAPRPAEMPALPELSWPALEFALVESVHGRYRTLEAFQLR